MFHTTRTYTCTWYKHRLYILRNWGYVVYTIYGISRLHNLGVSRYMIYMSPTSQYVTYTYTTQQLDPILHTKHDATLCECIFYHRKCIFNSNHVYCYDCIDALYIQLIITLIHVDLHEMACVVRHDDDEGIKMRRNGDSGNVYITGRRVHIHSPVHISTH